MEILILILLLGGGIVAAWQIRKRVNAFDKEMEERQKSREEVTRLLRESRETLEDHEKRIAALENER